MTYLNFDLQLSPQEQKSIQKRREEFRSIYTGYEDNDDDTSIDEKSPTLKTDNNINNNGLFSNLCSQLTKSIEACLPK